MKPLGGFFASADRDRGTHWYCDKCNSHYYPHIANNEIVYTWYDAKTWYDYINDYD